VSKKKAYLSPEAQERFQRNTSGLPSLRFKEVVPVPEVKGPPGRVEDPHPVVFDGRDTKVALVAVVAAFVVGLRGVALAAVGAAPFFLAGNPTYRRIADRLPL